MKIYFDSDLKMQFELFVSDFWQKLEIKKINYSLIIEI